MNALRLAFFVFLLQTSITVIAIADLPISCTSDRTACLHFNANTIGGTTLSNILAEEVDESNYKATQIEADVDADVWTAGAQAASMVTSLGYGAIIGIYSFTVFIFGFSGISASIGAFLQGIVYYFYFTLLKSVFRDTTGEI